MYYHKEPKSCKHYTEKDGIIYCGRDGSARRKGCPCPKFEITGWAKFKQKWKRFWNIY